jgi:hypothetical protein
VGALTLAWNLRKVAAQKCLSPEPLKQPNCRWQCALGVGRALNSPQGADMAAEVKCMAVSRMPKKVEEGANFDRIYAKPFLASSYG